MKARVLVVDDEESIVKLLERNFTREGLEVEVASDGEEAMKKIQKQQFDVVVLDVMLPGKDGLEILKQMKEEKIMTPVIMLSARGEEIDKVLGLELGADDYVTKPFGVRELVARVKAVLRRRQVVVNQEKEVLEAGDLVLYPGRHEAVARGQKMELTSKEFELLLALVSNKGRVLKRDHLLQKLWEYPGAANTRVLDVYISRLREKLESSGVSSVAIKTVRGLGYKLEEVGHGKEL